MAGRAWLDQRATNLAGHWPPGIKQERVRVARFRRMVVCLLLLRFITAAAPELTEALRLQALEAGF